MPHALDWECDAVIRLPAFTVCQIITSFESVCASAYASHGISQVADTWDANEDQTNSRPYAKRFEEQL
jgi:hypothetical protein